MDVQRPKNKFYDLAAAAVILVDTEAEARQGNPGLFIGHQAAGVIHTYPLIFAGLDDDNVRFSRKKLVQRSDYGPYSGKREHDYDNTRMTFEQLAQTTEEAIAAKKPVPFAHIKALLAIGQKFS